MNELSDFKIGDHLVCPSLSQIVREDRAVHVEPRSMDVLLALARNGRELSPKKDLIEAVWGQAFVSDEVLTHAVWDLRKAFGDSAQKPRFIQTIPKRGYRLIAEVERPETAPAAPVESSARSSAAFVWLVAGATLVFALVSFIRSQPLARPLATERSYVLEVVAKPTDQGVSTLARQLSQDLALRLTGASNLQVVEKEICSQAAPERTYCLVADVVERGGFRIARAQVTDAHTGSAAFSPPPQQIGSPAEAVEELTELVTAYFEALELPLFGSPDLRPWFDLSRHDIRAIRDFVQAAGYVYQHEVGARDGLSAALEHDPDFLAPRIWRSPRVVLESDQPTLDEYLVHFDRLYADATTFEKAMIDWARALAAGDLARQLRYLNGALRVHGDNRPTLFMKGVTLTRLGETGMALEVFQPLVLQEWDFPGVYAPAAECALLLGRPEQARTILDSALALQAKVPPRPVDPEALRLLELLAVYEGDAEAEASFGDRLAKRIAEMSPETIDYDTSPFAEKLAELAEVEDRRGVAKRLREFSD